MQQFRKIEDYNYIHFFNDEDYNSITFSKKLIYSPIWKSKETPQKALEKKNSFKMFGQEKLKNIL